MTAERDLLVTIGVAAVSSLKVEQAKVARFDLRTTHFDNGARRQNMRSPPGVTWQGWIALAARWILRCRFSGAEPQPLPASDHGIASERNIKSFVDRLRALTIGHPVSDERLQGFGLFIRPDYEMPHIPRPVAFSSLPFCPL